MNSSESTEGSLDTIGESVPINKLEVTKNENEIFEEQNKGSKNKHKHRVFICSLYIFAALGLAMITTRFYHYIASEEYQWMSAQQLQSLDKLLFTGAFGAGLGRYGNKLFS